MENDLEVASTLPELVNEGVVGDPTKPIE